MKPSPLDHLPRRSLFAQDVRKELSAQPTEAGGVARVVEI
jgi:hypothetical protein